MAGDNMGGQVFEEKTTTNTTSSKAGAESKASESNVRRSLRGKSYEERRKALKPKEEPPSVQELDSQNPLLKKNQPDLLQTMGVRSANSELSVSPVAGPPQRGAFPVTETKPRGPEVGLHVSDEGATVSVEGKKIRLDLAVLHSPPTNLTEDGMLAAVRINPQGNVRLSAGAGYLPKLYGIVPGPKAKSPEPRVLAFVSIDAQGNVVQLPAPAGCTFTVDAQGHITLVAPIDLVAAPGPLGDLGRHVDMTAMLGMSSVDAQVDAKVTKTVGKDVSAQLGYTGFVDLLFNAARYEMGGKGVPLASHILFAGVHGKGSAADWDVGATAPVASPTNRYPTSPEVVASIRPKSPVVPNLDVRAGPGAGGLHYAGLSKEMEVGKAQVGAQAGVINPFDPTSRDFRASVGVRIPLGAGGGGQTSFKHDLYSHVKEEHHGEIPTPKSYSPEECFTPEERARLEEFVKRHKPDENGQPKEPVTEADLKWLAEFLGSPERVAAFHNGYWEYDYERLAKYIGGAGLDYDRSAYSPLESLSRMKSVCCDYSALWTAMLEKQGYEAHTIAYLGADTGHVVCVYRTKNGRWNVLDNGYIIPTEASSMEMALQQALPEAWCYIEYDRPADDMRPVPVSKTETRDLQRILQFIRGTS